MSSLPQVISSAGLSGISGRFSGRFLKWFFHFLSLSSWLAAFSFALKVLFLPLTLYNQYTVAVTPPKKTKKKTSLILFGKHIKDKLQMTNRKTYQTNIVFSGSQKNLGEMR